MAEHCSICDTRRPFGGTKTLILNNGELWLEFCQNCADAPITNAQTGETIAVGTLYASSAGEPDPGITPRTSEPMSHEEALKSLEPLNEQIERIEMMTWEEKLEEWMSK